MNSGTDRLLLSGICVLLILLFCALYHPPGGQFGFIESGVSIQISGGFFGSRCTSGLLQKCGGVRNGIELNLGVFWLHFCLTVAFSG